MPEKKQFDNRDKSSSLIREEPSWRFGVNTDILINQARAYCEHVGLSISTVGTYSAQDGKFFIRLEDGCSCTIKTANKVVDWFDQNWPADLDWPEGIERPTKNSEAA